MQASGSSTQRLQGSLLSTGKGNIVNKNVIRYGRPGGRPLKAAVNIYILLLLGLISKSLHFFAVTQKCF